VPVAPGEGRWAWARRRAGRIALSLVGIAGALSCCTGAAVAWGPAVAAPANPLESLWAFLKSSLGQLSELVYPGPQRDVLELLLATTLVVPAIRRLKTSPIIGFLLMGVFMGPSGLNLVSNLRSTRHLAELGIIFFLFEMGLELSVEKVLAMKRDVFGLGGAQYLGTGLLIALFAGLLAPSLAPGALVVLGGALALSSSAFALQLLRDKGQLASPYGRASFGVLLFQDLAVVPLLVVVPLLAGSGGGASLLMALFQAAVRGGIALGIIFIFGKAVLERIFRFVMRSKSPEAFLAITLGTVLLCSSITEGMGLSNTLGAFCGGVLLSETSYRHQIEADIAPFRGMLLGLFFITVGFSIDLRVVASSWMLLVPLILGLLLLKAGVVVGACLGNGLRVASSIQTAMLLAPGGEFAFVVFKLAEKLRLLPAATTQLLVTATALSMALTPLLAKVGERAAKELRKRKGPANLEGRDEEAMNLVKKMREADGGFVVICGYGRIGKVICQLLDIEVENNYFVLENDPSKAIQARSEGLPVFLADCQRKEVCENFYLGEARLIIVAMSNQKVVNNVANTITKLYPKAPMLVRARDDDHQEYLAKNLGLDVVCPALPPDSALLSLPFGGEVLRRLGKDEEEVLNLLEEQRRIIYSEGGLDDGPLTDQAIVEVFSNFDRDGSGYLDVNEMKEAFERLGKSMTDEQIKEMMASADMDDSGEISLVEFKALLQQKVLDDED